MIGRPFSQQEVLLADGGAPVPVAPPPLPGDTAPAVTPPPELAPAPSGGDAAVVGCPATSNCEHTGVCLKLSFRSRQIIRGYQVYVCKQILVGAPIKSHCFLS
jgi:hypothetical protein